MICDVRQLFLFFPVPVTQPWCLQTISVKNLWTWLVLPSENRNVYFGQCLSSRAIRRAYEHLEATGQFFSHSRKQACPLSLDYDTSSASGCCQQLPYQHSARHSESDNIHCECLVDTSSTKVPGAPCQPSNTSVWVAHISRNTNCCIYFLNMESGFPYFSDKLLRSDEAHIAKNAQVNTHGVQHQQPTLCGICREPAPMVL